MRWHIIAIGKPRLEFARVGLDDYAGRVKPFAPVEVSFIKQSTASTESAALLERSKGMFRIVLDEAGEHLTSRQLSKKICEWEMHGPRDFAVLVGGADGHADELRQAAGWTWSLSRLTLQHELALVVAMEQLYRAYTIKAGLPYHRD